MMKTVTDLCEELGIELKPPDGQPYHCGNRMKVKSGICGPDYAECNCGLRIGNMLSPHINGGIIPDENWIEEHGEATWVKLNDLS